MIKRIINIIKEFLNAGNERSILIKKNIIISLGIKLCTVFITMALYPLTLDYLDQERNGVWITLTNMVLWIALFDLGFGNGLKNKYAEAKAKGDLTLAKKYISSTYAILSLLWISFFLLFSLINPLLDWTKIFPHISAEYVNELYEVSWIVFYSFGLLFIVRLLANIIIADQRPAFTSFIDMIGQLLTLIGVFILTKYTIPSLPKLGLIAGLSPVITYSIASIVLFNTRYKKVRPSFRYIKFSLGKELLTLGIKFFITTAAALVVSQTLTFLIQYIINPAEVSRYGAAYKLFSFGLNVLVIIILPYWSSFTDAYTLKDYQWMQNALRHLRKIFVVFLVFQLIILSLSSFIYYYWINIWLKDSPLDISLKLSVAICAYICVMGWIYLNIYPINGTGRIKIQVYSSVFEMVCFIPLAFYLGNNFGVIGILLSPIIIYIPRMIWAPIQLNKLAKGSAKGLWNK